MKILIISDSHGKTDNIDRVINKVGNIDLMIHLGDFESSEDYIEAVAPCRLEMVAGNNDYSSERASEKLIQIGKYKALLVHGHRHRVHYDLETLKRYGIENNADIVMYGHTHIPYIEQGKGITVINPGSITLPRQERRKPSFILMEIDSENKVHYTLNFL
ncbi:metallophosphoesterase [Anaeromicropila herbilytica]|uniref:Phosphoesterase n=1 Tax=Anaeromicropila herbilytica TaxID=2785025 RepID=A0A7R7IBJ6_9FIRM|nr:metallophosphoesterase [Anaeromicropila herbilytica]BCN29677.1 phosphoesterase [Anaeromicropila herbilytica]